MDMQTESISIRLDGHFLLTLTAGPGEFIAANLNMDGQHHEHTFARGKGWATNVAQWALKRMTGQVNETTYKLLAKKLFIPFLKVEI